MAILDFIGLQEYSRPVVNVNRLKPIVAMMLLALFAFASSHPLLRALELIHQDATHTEDASGSDYGHDVADGICHNGSNGQTVQECVAGVAFDFASCLVWACVLLQPEVQDARANIANSSSPPPELGTTWQFSSRAALPVRAPSFAS